MMAALRPVKNMYVALEQKRVPIPGLNSTSQEIHVLHILSDKPVTE